MYFDWIDFLAELGGLTVLLVLFGCLLHTLLVPDDHDVLQQIEGLYTMYLPEGKSKKLKDIEWLL